MQIDKDNLVWMDLEMTGLNPKKDQIIEIATLVTDKDLNLLEYGPELVIQTPKALLDGMDDWCTQHHGDSGLTKKSLESTITMADAERQTLEFMQKWIPAGKSPLSGNSIHQDRRFLEVYMPQVDAYMHYRNLDVSVFKEIISRWYPKFPRMEKKGSHTALDDILESIEELKYYRKHILIPSNQI
ncbi:MAG: oligoribonuclease [SAR324 cluster bacterium]|nr:oligoribonuclease [SAR324 cluster bacterium]